ncbi:MAG: tetratricopeptide repeat protein [Anaerolineae bacterium]|nr:tetratricopeptide repeat protein [Anaerolineae bacterium]
MSRQVAYSRRALELRAAEYYAGIRKQESEWRTIEDLTSQRREFEHLLCAAAYDQASDVLCAIDYDYLYRWGYYNLLEELYIQLRGKVVDEIRQVDNLSGLGRTYHVQGKAQQALEQHQKALKLAQMHADRFRVSRELGRLGGLYLRIRELPTALDYQGRALAISKVEGYRSLELHQRIRLANIYYYLRNIPQATEEWNTALAIARELKNRQREGICLASLGSVQRRQGEMDPALHSYAVAEPILQEVGDRRGESTLCNSYAVTYRALGKYSAALAFHDRGLEIARAIGFWDHQGVHLNGIGKLHYISGNLEKARACYNEALTIFMRGDERGSSYTLIGLGEVDLSQGHISEAENYFARALAMDEPCTYHHVLLKLGIVSLRSDFSRAQGYFAKVITDRRVTDENSRLYENFYAMALAKVGLAVCDPHWLELSQRNSLLAPACAEYCQAMEISSVAGVLRDALRNLELIRDAGIAGLEPVFELLEGTLYEHP